MTTLSIWKIVRLAAVVATLTVAVGVSTLAAHVGPGVDVEQEQSAAQPPLVPISVDVVLTRTNGSEQISRLPFTLVLNANDRNPTIIRMGVQVPVPSTRSGDGGSTVSYQNVGTQLDATADTSGDAFLVRLSITDSSLYEPSGPDRTPTVVGGYPVIRSFLSQNRVLIRNGETRDYTMATDKISGEVMRVSVTLTVLEQG